MLFRFRDPKVATLSSVQLFSSLSRRDLVALGAICDIVTVEAGRSLVTEGDIGREFFVILDGTAEVATDDETVALLLKGDFFGELSLLGNRVRTADVTARTDMSVLVMDRRQFATLIDREPEVGMRIRSVVAMRLAELREVAA